jgi:hypothetical protein
MPLLILAPEPQPIPLSGETEHITVKFSTARAVRVPVHIEHKQ